MQEQVFDEDPLQGGGSKLFRRGAKILRLRQRRVLWAVIFVELSHVLFYVRIGDELAASYKRNTELEGVGVSTHEPADCLADFEHTNVVSFLPVHVHGVSNGIDIFLVVE